MQGGRPGEPAPGCMICGIRGWTTRAIRGYVLGAVDEPAGGFCVSGSRSSPSARCPDRAQVAPAGNRPVGLFVTPPNTMLLGGRGPRRVAPVRDAGRSAALDLHPHHQLASIANLVC